MINLPLSDELFFRAQGASLNQDGYVTRGPQELGGAEEVDRAAAARVGTHR